MAEQTREQLREERRRRIDQRAQVDRERERRRQRRTILRIAIPIGIGALILAVILFFAVREATAPMPGEALANEGATHVEPGTPLDYSTYPPASGPHYAQTANRGFYETSVQPGFWVHSLEHGYVVILYKCPPDCTQLKSQLRSLYNSLRPSQRYGYQKAIIAPDDRIDSRLAALAWTRRMTLDEFDEGRLRGFYQALVDRGPEDAP